MAGSCIQHCIKHTYMGFVFQPNHQLEFKVNDLRLEAVLADF